MSSKIVLKKEIGVLKGASIIMGVIIGSGIFVSPIGVLKYTKSVGFSFIMWIVSGLFSTFGAIVYAELGVTIPRSGGEYSYVLEVFGPILAFLCLWITFIVIGAVSCAANSLVFAEYLLRPFFPDCDVPNICITLLAASAILLIAFINAYSVKFATKMAIFFTASKVLALLMIICFGAYYLIMGHVDSFIDSFEDSAYSVDSIALSFYQGFWAFGGWNYLNFLTEEIKNPTRNLPLAILVSMFAIIVTYLLTNVAYLAVLSPREMLDLGESSVAVAVIFAMKTMGPAAFLMPFFVSASVFGSINGEFLSMSRLLATGAEDGHLPEYFSMINFNLITPIPAVITMCLFALGFLFYEDIFALIELSGFAFVLVSSMAVCSLIFFRHKNPKHDSGFKLPIFIPYLFLITDIILGGMTVWIKPKESLYSLLLMLSGLIYYLLWSFRPQISKDFISKLYCADITLLTWHTLPIRRRYEKIE
ncbi:hypothetical protein Ciccas_010348 [Cichlidogyrus casuarinus]|uniref:Amino acid permease n=1 Tax=Cichlidogyrus casuarinus TaxID=1844966 RepID=A0ABD2PUF8_9PLAT